MIAVNDVSVNSKRRLVEAVFILCLLPAIAHNNVSAKTQELRTQTLQIEEESEVLEGLFKERRNACRLHCDGLSPAKGQPSHVCQRFSPTSCNDNEGPGLLQITPFGLVGVPLLASGGAGRRLLHSAMNLPHRVMSSIAALIRSISTGTDPR